MNYEMAQIHFRQKDSATAIEIFLDDVALVSSLKKVIFEKISEFVINSMQIVLFSPPESYKLIILAKIN
jgi:hypothetical protein